MTTLAELTVSSRSSVVSTGTAVLDASAHRAIAEEQHWAPRQQVQAKPRELPRAHVPVDLVVGRRPGMRR
ncbi:hypothetical protein ACWGVR_10120 [Streptomyces xanthophaeus]